MNQPLICSGNLSRDSLAGQVAVVTGAGGGIGFEAARSLAWLGARVIIAEISGSGAAAAERINRETGCNAALFVKTDIGDEKSVGNLAGIAGRHFGKVDIVLNNATVAPLGAVDALPISLWDDSYRVNLRGPVLLAQKFLPGMKQRDYGVFVCVTSEGLAFMGAYESVKAALSHLARTIEAELEGTGVISFTIGPGMVPTAAANRGLEQLALMHGKSVADMQELVKQHTITVEEAGAALAASIAFAERFRGQDLGAKQALNAAGISYSEGSGASGQAKLTSEELGNALLLLGDVRKTLSEQAEGWKSRSIFERQWMLRDFKKHAGLPVEQWLEAIDKLEGFLKQADFEAVTRLYAPLGRLSGFYLHMQDLARGYIKDKKELEQNLHIVREWQAAAEKLAGILGK